MQRRANIQKFTANFTTGDTGIATAGNSNAAFDEHGGGGPVFEERFFQIRECVREVTLHVVDHTGQLILEEEKIAIIGTTLWTDFFGGNPIAMFDVSQGLNDAVGKRSDRYNTWMGFFMHELTHLLFATQARQAGTNKRLDCRQKSLSRELSR